MDTHAWDKIVRKAQSGDSSAIYSIMKCFEKKVIKEAIKHVGRDSAEFDEYFSTGTDGIWAAIKVE